MPGAVRYDPEDPEHRAWLQRVEARIMAPRGYNQCQRAPRSRYQVQVVYDRPMRPRRSSRAWRDRSVRDGLRFLDAATNSTVVHQGGTSRVRWVESALASMPAGACPCRGDLEDPGPWHLRQCANYSAKYSEPIPRTNDETLL